MCEYLRCLRKTNNIGGFCNLTRDENTTAMDLYKAIQGNSQFIYRGISKEFALKRFVFSDASGMNMNDAASRLFYFGDKAKACVEGKLEFLPNLKDITRKELLKISHETKRALLDDYEGKNEFILCNKEFHDFFTSNDLDKNISDLFTTLDKIYRIRLRNMLISFLHTHGENDYKQESALVSTSTDYHFAQEFTNEIQSIVLICWLPQPEERFAVRAKPEDGYYAELKTHGFPIIESEIYDFESEVSVIGAIFPHFIFGYYDNETNETVLNNNIFKYYRHPLTSAKHGLFIDQSTFKKEIKDKTKYRRWAELQTHCVGLQVA